MCTTSRSPGLREQHPQHGERNLTKVLAVCAALFMFMMMVACEAQPSVAKAAPPPPIASPAAPPVDAPDAMEREAEQFAQRIEQTPAASVSAPAGSASAAQVQWVATEPVMAVTAVEAAKPKATEAPVPVDVVADLHIAPQPPQSPVPMEPLTVNQLIEQLSARLEAQYQSDSPQVRAALAAAAMSLADPARELTEKDLLSLSSEDRQLVLTYQRTFTRIGQSLDGRDAAEDRQTLRLAAEELNEQLQGDQKLRIRRAALCVKVSGYGIYTPFPSQTFLAGREHPVIVYAELDHFRAEAEADGLFTVRLTQEIVVYNEADGLAVWRVKPTEIMDRSRNRRRDFFVVQIAQLPDRLSVGKYILSLTVTDLHGQALDEAKIPIQIVADASALPSGAAGQ